MYRQIYISGTQEVTADLYSSNTASLAVYIRYANIGDCQCDVQYLPCMLTVKCLTTARQYTRYICANCDTALYKYLPLASYKIIATIGGTSYCTTYTLTTNSRIMLHALPVVDVSHDNCNASYNTNCSNSCKCCMCCKCGNCCSRHNRHNCCMCCDYKS